MQSLQENLSNPAALKMIQNLQVQLKAVQTEIVKEKKKAKKSSRTDSDHANAQTIHKDELANDVLACQIDNDESNQMEKDIVQTNEIPVAEESVLPAAEDASKLPPKPQPRHPPAHSRPLTAAGRVPAVRASIAGFSHNHSGSPQKQTGVMSMSMSKSELLREVRKQKDQHRKEIR